MISCVDDAIVQSGISSGVSKEKGDYVRTVLLTELLTDHLPRLPLYLRELQCALEGSSTDLEKVCVIVKSNPIFCENFVRIGSMAESVEPIRLPVDHLVVLLGKQRVWTVAVAAFLLTEIGSNWSSMAKKKVARIALTRANRALASAKAVDDSAPEQAYAAGVLSVAGLLPLVDVSCASDQVPEWIDSAEEALEKQRKFFGTDFLELNRWIRVIWRLPLDTPYAMTEPVRYQPEVREFHCPVPFLGNDLGGHNLVVVSRGSV